MGGGPAVRSIRRGLQLLDEVDEGEAALADLTEDTEAALVDPDVAAARRRVVESVEPRDGAAHRCAPFHSSLLVAGEEQGRAAPSESLARLVRCLRTSQVNHRDSDFLRLRYSFHFIRKKEVVTNIHGTLVSGRVPDLHAKPRTLTRRCKLNFEITVKIHQPVPHKLCYSEFKRRRKNSAAVSHSNLQYEIWYFCPEKQVNVRIPPWLQNNNAVLVNQATKKCHLVSILALLLVEGSQSTSWRTDSE